MLVEESLKIKNFIENSSFNNFSVLNLGSGDKHFREYIQPYVDRNVIKPFEKKGCKVINLDLYGGEGIDIRLDFANLDKLQQVFDVVMCSNSFEHVENREKLGKDIIRLVRKGGYIIVTTPRVFPYHKDPEDSLFRPTIEEQASLLPGTHQIESGYIDIKRPYESRGILLPLQLMKLMMLVKSLRYKLTGEKFDFKADLISIIKPWQVTYLVLQKD